MEELEESRFLILISIPQFLKLKEEIQGLRFKTAKDGLTVLLSADIGEDFVCFHLCSCSAYSGT